MDQRTERLAAEKRGYVHNPIAEGATEKFVFARRKPKDRTTRPKFYFYTPDLEDLVIAASAKKVKTGTAFKMSLSSKDIKKKSPFYVGLCTDFQAKKQFVGYKVFPDKPNMFISAVKIVNDRKEGDSVFLPPANAKADFQFPPDVLTGEESEGKFEGIVGMSLVAQPQPMAMETGFETITLKKGEETAMTITQTATEEFEVDVGGPMSVFQAFCIACVVTS